MRCLLQGQVHCLLRGLVLTAVRVLQLEQGQEQEQVLGLVQELVQELVHWLLRGVCLNHQNSEGIHWGPQRFQSLQGQHQPQQQLRLYLLKM